MSEMVVGIEGTLYLEYINAYYLLININIIVAHYYCIVIVITCISLQSNTLTWRNYDVIISYGVWDL